MGTATTKQADVLVALADSVSLFCTASQEAFADVEVRGHRETWPVDSKNFRLWLEREYWRNRKTTANKEALATAQSLLTARARFEGGTKDVFLRVGHHGGRLYLDLGNEDWSAIEIDRNGWRLVARPPVRFLRPKSLAKIPTPVGGGSIEALRSHLNVKSDDDFVLVTTWALACLRSQGPFPVLVLGGEQGSAKSTFARILKSLLDPSTAPLRSLPRSEQDLFITAKKNNVLAFDNVSNLTPLLSDAFCKLATGGGFATRALYTDDDEAIFEGARPIILNGITSFVTRDDLADRAVTLVLNPISERKRRSESEFWADFEIERPGILGVLLDAVSRGIAKLPETQLDHLPRMADFAKWGVACESALWNRGAFTTAYQSNRVEASERLIESDPFAGAAQTLVSLRRYWSGTATELLAALNEVADSRVTRLANWPKTARAASDRLSRTAPALRRTGMRIEFSRTGHDRKRMIDIHAAN